MHRLRKLLGDSNAITVEDQTISLNERIVWTDIRELEVLFNLVAAAGDAHTGAAHSAAERVFSAYLGPFLESDAEAAWAVSMREKLRSRFIQLVSDRGRWLERKNRWDDAIRWYLRGIEADELTEAFYQGLMHCYLNADRPAEGLSVFRRLRKTLSLILSITPSPASEEIYRHLQVRQRGPAARPLNSVRNR